MPSRHVILMLATGLLLVSGWATIGETLHCAVVSSGAESEAGEVGTVQNLGQAIIGRSSNRFIRLHAGVIPCYDLQLTCSDDIQGFTACLSGPMLGGETSLSCACHDADEDGDVDLLDFARHQILHVP